MSVTFLRALIVPSLVTVGSTGCMGNIDMKPVTPPHEIAAMKVVVGAPVEVMRANRTSEGTWVQPAALWLQSGQATVLDGAQLKQRTGNTFQSLTIGTTDDARAPGSLKALTVRNDGVFLAGSGGFFHDAPGHLLRSPLSDSFSMDSIRFVDFVDGALWVTTSTDAVRVLEGSRRTLRITDADEAGALQAVVGRSASRALVVKGGSLYAVDLEASVVTTLARGLATVTSLSRRAEVVLLGTTEGLVEVGADDVVTRRTLVSAGMNAASIIDVEPAGASTLVTTTSQVLHVTGAGAVVLADVTHPWPDAVAEDLAGDVWFLDGASVARLSTSLAPPPPSFEADVKPFFAAHCSSCHATGASYAPLLDLENYGVARTWARASLARLTDTLSPMPPLNREVLTPAQYAVVVRWIDGGLLP